MRRIISKSQYSGYIQVHTAEENPRTFQTTLSPTLSSMDGIDKGFRNGHQAKQTDWSKRGASHDNLQGPKRLRCLEGMRQKTWLPSGRNKFTQRLVWELYTVGCALHRWCITPPC